VPLAPPVLESDGRIGIVLSSANRPPVVCLSISNVRTGRTSGTLTISPRG